MSSVEWLAMAFFILICTMASVLANAMHRANSRAQQAKAQAESTLEHRSKVDIIWRSGNHLLEDIDENLSDFSFPLFINKLS